MITEAESPPLGEVKVVTRLVVLFDSCWVVAFFSRVCLRLKPRLSSGLYFLRTII